MGRNKARHYDTRRRDYDPNINPCAPCRSIFKGSLRRKSLDKLTSPKSVSKGNRKSLSKYR